MSTDELPTPKLPDLPDDETTDAALPARGSRHDPLVGKVLDQRYRIQGLVARGGMGRVYRAEQAPFGRIVAIKVLEVGLEQDEDQEFRRRFIREAETCARLSHPNTVRVFEYGKTWDDVLYIAMEFLEGRNLFQAIQTDAPMDALRVINIGKQVAASVREAHTLGLIHRDLKPSNIILTRPGGGEEFVKVVDFGLAKEIRGESELTRVDSLVGSPSYMSPEQVRSAVLDQRSDVYSLGVLLYACLTGRPPFAAPSSLGVLMGHLNQLPPRMRDVCPSMKPSPALEAVVLRCLEKRPEDRFPDMDALTAALQACEDELRGVSNPRVPPPPRALVARKEAVPEPSLILPKRRFPLAVAAILGAMALGLVAVVAIAWLVLRSPEPEAGASRGAPPETPTATASAPPEPTPAPASLGPAPDAAAPLSPAEPGPAAPAPPSDRPRAATRARSTAATTRAAPAGSSAPDSRAAPPPDSPEPPPPASERPPSGRASGSDVRDPWEEH